MLISFAVEAELASILASRSCTASWTACGVIGEPISAFKEAGRGEGDRHPNGG
jgi:hypothetical protein